jgi:hypothetical protein
MGLRCEVCNNQEQFVSKYDQTCERCGQGEGVIVLVVSLISLIIVVGGCFWYVKKFMPHADIAGAVQARSMKARVLLSFAQICSRTPVTFRLSFPPVVMNFFRYVQFLEVFDIFSFLGNVECLVGSDFIVRLRVKVIGTLVVLVTVAVVHLLTKQAWLFNLLLTLSFLSYSSVTTTLFESLDCQSFEDGKSYLLVDPQILCTSDYYRENLHFVVLPMIFVFVLGVPVGYYALLRFHLRYIQPKQEAVHRQFPLAPVVGGSPSMLAHQYRLMDAVTQQKIGNISFLWAGYTAECWYFEVLEMIKKFCFTGLPLLTRMAQGPEKLEVGYGILLGVVFAHLYSGGPYLQSSNRKLQMVCQHQLTITLLMGSIADYAEQSTAIKIVGGIIIIGSCLPMLLFLVFGVVHPERADFVLHSDKEKAESRAHGNK